MSQFDDMYTEIAVPALFEHHSRGTTVEYIDGENDPVTLTVIERNEQSDEQPEQEGRKRLRMKDIIISTDPDSSYGGVAAPAEHAQIQMDGETWSIEAVEALSQSLARLRIIRRSSMERSRESYRPRR